MAIEYDPETRCSYSGCNNIATNFNCYQIGYHLCSECLEDIEEFEGEYGEYLKEEARNA